jgi:glucosylceramidase
MSQFSLGPRPERLIPYVKAALAIRPDLTHLVPPPGPRPVWMKDNNAYEAGNFIDKDEYYKAYALIPRKVRRRIRKGRHQPCPRCRSERTDGRYRLSGTEEGSRNSSLNSSATSAPLFEKNKVPRRDLARNLQRLEITARFAKTVLDDPSAQKNTSGPSASSGTVHRQLPQLKKEHPDVPVNQRKPTAATGTGNPVQQVRRAANDFAYAFYTWGRMRDYFAAGAEAYMLWNHVLDQNGKNIDKETCPGRRTAAVVIDTDAKKVIWTPMFRAFGTKAAIYPLDRSVLHTTDRCGTR